MDSPGLGIRTAAGKKVIQLVDRLLAKVIQYQFIHEMHIRREQHCGFAFMVDAVQQVIEYQRLGFAERRLV